MQHHQHVEMCLSQPASLILACLVEEPKTATAWHETVVQATGQVIEPSAFSRIVARLEQRGWIEAMRTELPLRLYQITALGLLAFERADAHRQGEKQKVGAHPDWRKGKEIIMGLVLWILRLYPPTWRERYETEKVALLEQHEITFWTVVDLFIGALDARLDPHYRRPRQLLPMRRLHNSWRLIASACVACWLGFVIWFWRMGDMPIPAWVQCTLEDLSCPVRKAVGAAHTLPLSNALVVLLVSLFAFFLVFLVVFVRWVVAQTIQRKQWWNLLRLLPLASFLLLVIKPPSLSGWLDDLVQVVFVASVALLVASGGAMLTPARRWFEEKSSLRPYNTPLLALFVLLCVLFLTGGVILLGLAQGIQLVAIWNLLPQLNLYYPDISSQLIVGCVMMALASTVSLAALVRGTLA